jgi:hypothetical protein
LSFSSIEKDAVHSLPDYEYKGLFYSGYLSSNSVKNFHYILNEADFDSDKKPLVLWLNGGPGCSSLEGWAKENGPYGIEKVIQGVKTETVPLGELKDMATDRILLFDESLMTYAMGNCITLEDTNGNRKLLKKRHDEKIDNVAALMDAWVAYKLHKDDFN